MSNCYIKYLYTENDIFYTCFRKYSLNPPFNASTPKSPETRAFLYILTMILTGLSHFLELPQINFFLFIYRIMRGTVSESGLRIIKIVYLFVQKSKFQKDQNQESGTPNALTKIPVQAIMWPDRKQVDIVRLCSIISVIPYIVVCVQYCCVHRRSVWY